MARTGLVLWLCSEGSRKRKGFQFCFKPNRRSAFTSTCFLQYIGVRCSIVTYLVCKIGPAGRVWPPLEGLRRKEIEVTEGGMRWGLGRPLLSLSPLSFCFLFAPSSTRERVYRLFCILSEIGVDFRALEIGSHSSGGIFRPDILCQKDWNLGYCIPTTIFTNEFEPFFQFCRVIVNV